MKPYYQDDRATIYHGDCRDVVGELYCKTMDLMVTDPPYGQNWRSGWREEKFDNIIGDNGDLDVIEALDNLILTLKPNRHIYVFGNFDLSNLPITSIVELIWDKMMTGPGDLSIPWGPAHEKIYFGVYRPSKANRENGQGRLSARLRQGSILRVPRLNSRGVEKHPTEKPVALLRQLIESSSLVNETVFDPFMGVASTLVAAALEGRKSVGIEIDERYCEIGANRLRKLQIPVESEF